MSVLALDLGTNMGWCRAQRGAWVWGTAKFKRSAWEGQGAALLRFRRWLERATVLTPSAVVYEQATGSQRGPAMRMIAAQTAVVQILCEERTIPYFGVNVQTLKAYAVDKKVREKLGIKGTAKKEHMEAALRMYWGERLGAQGQRMPRSLTNDEIDALWLASYALDRLLPKEDQ